MLEKEIIWVNLFMPNQARYLISVQVTFVRHVDYAHALMCANAVVLSFRVTRRM